MLRDGASAIYGSDAIAGVINIITRKEFQGISVSGDASIPQANGGANYAATLMGGFGSLAKEGWNIFAGFSYNKQEQVTALDRSYASSGLNPTKGCSWRRPATDHPGKLQPVEARA